MCRWIKSETAAQNNICLLQQISRASEILMCKISVWLVLSYRTVPGVFKETMMRNNDGVKELQEDRNTEKKRRVLSSIIH